MAISGVAGAELRRMAPITVMTRGEAGALITADGEEFEIPAARPRAVVDPTGAGDAFRPGFVLGMKRGWPWPVVGRVAALTAVYAVEHRGPQRHSYTPDDSATATARISARPPRSTPCSPDRGPDSTARPPCREDAGSSPRRSSSPCWSRPKSRSAVAAPLGVRPDRQ